MHINREGSWMELEGYKWRAPTYRQVPIEPLMKRDQENGIQTRNLVCGTFFLLHRYPDLRFCCHSAGSDFRRKRCIPIFHFGSVSFVVRPVCGRLLTKVCRTWSRRFESERCRQRQ